MGGARSRGELIQRRVRGARTAPSSRVTGVHAELLDGVARDEDLRAVGLVRAEAARDTIRRLDAIGTAGRSSRRSCPRRRPGRRPSCEGAGGRRRRAAFGGARAPCAARGESSAAGGAGAVRRRAIRGCSRWPRASQVPSGGVGVGSRRGGEGGGGFLAGTAMYVSTMATFPEMDAGAVGTRGTPAAELRDAAAASDRRPRDRRGESRRPRPWPHRAARALAAALVHGGRKERRSRKGTSIGGCRQR